MCLILERENQGLKPKGRDKRAFEYVWSWSFTENLCLHHVSLSEASESRGSENTLEEE